MAIFRGSFWRAKTVLVNCLETHPPFSSLQQSHSNNIFSFAGLFRGISSLGRLCSESAKLLPFCGGYSQCSRYLLLLAGDVERNPGPISEDAKPKLYDLQCMPYTNEDGVSVYFRLMDYIKPRLTRVAIALGFPPHIIDVIEKKSDPEYFLLSEWLEGRNQEHDSRPLTWATLITALQHAGLMKEVKILEQHFLVTPVATDVPQTSSTDVHTNFVSEDPDLVQHPGGGYTSHHGPVKVFVRPGPDIPKSLVSLMKNYANMLAVLRNTKLRKTKFLVLKRFLSDFCDEESIQQCPTIDRVINHLKRHLKIYIFNIDALDASCDHFYSSEVKKSLQQYKLELNSFLSSTSVKEFKGTLEMKIVDSSNVEIVTIKLDESRTENTLEVLRKLVFHFFGIHYKVLIHCGIKKGCVLITWIVPTSLIPILREKAEQLSPEYLASNGVLELVIGLRIVPNEAFLSGHTTTTVTKVNRASGSDVDIHTGAIIDLHSKTGIKQHAMGVDSSDITISAIQKRHQSDLEAAQRDMEMLQQKLANSKERLECELDKAKCSAQAEFGKKVQTLEKLTTEKEAFDPALQSIPVTVGGVKLELVIDELKEIADDWRQLGGHLMSPHRLKEIELQEESPVKCLELVIVNWKESYPNGTLLDIVAALEKIEKFKLADHIQQKYISPVIQESSKGIYHQALLRGKAKVSYGRIMFLGPAAVGKTSLRHGLMNKPLPDMANSTVLAHTHLVKYSWVKSGRLSTYCWAEMSKEDEISENLQLFHRYRTSLTDAEKYSWGSVVDERRIVHSEVSAHEAVIMSRLVSSEKIEDHEVLLFLWDCGGQPVFLDLLPAFLSLRTVFLLMFDASKSLDEPFQVVINNKGQQWNEAVLQISILSVLQKWMSSIHARFGTVGQSGQLPTYPRIIVVGTHADQLAPGQPIQARNEAVAQVFSKISAAVERNEYADMILGMLMVDNTCAGKSDQTGSGFEELHRTIATFVQENLTKETPISWIHLRKVLQLYTKKKKPVISLEEVYSIAKDCHMPREDVPSALLFFHELGVFLFYVNIKSLKSVVFLEPQWLVDRFGELLAKWKEEPEHKDMWNTLARYGILVEPLYEAALSKVKEFGLTPSSLVDMLEHFCLAAPIVTNGVHPKSGKVNEYFVPLMLDHHLPQSTLSSSPPQPSAVESAAPIHLTFLSGYVPPGYFVRLATSLSAKKEVNVLFHPYIFRDQITMDIGVDRLTITEHNDTIELHFSRHDSLREPFRESCQRVLKILHKCFAEVYQWLPGASAWLAFLCSECKVDISWKSRACPFTVDQLDTEHLHCQMGHHSLPTLPERYWLQPDSSLYKIDEVSKSLTADALVVLAEKLEVNPLAVIVDQFYKNGGDYVELAQAVSDVKTMTAKQSPSQDTRGMDPHSTASKLQPTTSRSSSLSSRPTMKDLISMKRRDGSDKDLEILDWITAHDSSQCDNFGHKLLEDRLAMKKLRKKHKDDDDKFIRAVLEKWLSRDDDDKKGSLPCTWEALVQCAQEAGLDGEFVKLLRDNVL